MFTSAQTAGRIAAQLGCSFDPQRKQHLANAADLRAKNEVLQAQIRTSVRLSADQIIQDADSQLEHVALRASQKPPPSPHAEEAILDADHFPQDTTRLLGNKIWKVATGDDGVKYWVPVHVPSCSFPTAFITDRHRSLETGFAKNTVQNADEDALQQLHRFEVPEDMPQMPAVIGARAGQYLQQAQRAEQEGCEKQSAELRMNSAKQDYYRTIGYLSTDDMKAAETDLGRAQVKFRMQTKQKEAVEGEQRKLEGELLVAKSYMKDMKEEFYTKQTESDAMGMRFAVESLRLARYKVVVLMKQKRRINAKLKIYQCNYREARQHMLLAKQCFEQKLKKHEAAKLVMRANGDLPEEKTPKEQLKDEQARVVSAKAKLVLMEAEYAKMEVRERNLTDAIDRFEAKAEDALRGAGGNNNSSSGSSSDAGTLQGGSVVQGGVNQAEQEMIRKLLESQKETDNDEEGLLRALLKRKGTTSSGEVRGKIDELEKLFGSKKKMGSDLAEENEAHGHDVRDAKKDIAKYVQQMKADAGDDLREMVDMQRRGVDQEKVRAAQELKKVEYAMVQNVVGAVNDFQNDTDNALLSTGKQIETQEGLVFGIQQQVLDHKRLKALQTEMKKLANEIQLLRDAIQVMQGRVAELIDIIRQTDASFMKEKTAEEIEEEQREKRRKERETEEAERMAKNEPQIKVKEVEIPSLQPIDHYTATDPRLYEMTRYGHGVHVVNQTATGSEIYAYALIQFQKDKVWYEGFVDINFKPTSTGVFVREINRPETEGNSKMSPGDVERYRGEWKDGKLTIGFREVFDMTKSVPVTVFHGSWEMDSEFPPLFKPAVAAAPKAAAVSTTPPVADNEYDVDKVKQFDAKKIEFQCKEAFGYDRVKKRFYTNCDTIDNTQENTRSSTDGNVVIRRADDDKGNLLLSYGYVGEKSDCNAKAYYSWQWNEKDDKVFCQVGSNFKPDERVDGLMYKTFKTAAKLATTSARTFLRYIGLATNTVENTDSTRVFSGVASTGFHCTLPFKANDGLFKTTSGHFVENEATVYACKGDVKFGVPHGKCFVHYSGKTTDLQNIFVGQCFNGRPVQGYRQIWDKTLSKYTKFWGTFLTPTTANAQCYYANRNTGREEETDGSIEYIYLRRNFTSSTKVQSGENDVGVKSKIKTLCTNRAVTATVKLPDDKQVLPAVYKEFTEGLLDDKANCIIRGGMQLRGGAMEDGADGSQLSLLGLSASKDTIPRIDAAWLKEVEDKVAQLVLRMDVVVQKEQEYNSLLDTQKLLPDNADPAMTAQTTEVRMWVRNEKKDLSTAVVAYARSLRDALERCPRDGPGALRTVARTLADATKQTFCYEYKDPMCVLSDWLKYEF
jgi:hypothetical protein